MSTNLVIEGVDARSPPMIVDQFDNNKEPYDAKVLSMRQTDVPPSPSSIEYQTAKVKASSPCLHIRQNSKQRMRVLLRHQRVKIKSPS